ncbi:hypothetical protein ETAA8_06520 [Anatilimnocola aggregata]|uniref:Uncharacterized protein n=1 Tax=Anatilimnocola aggregata TaxID=2528021 RepID=A0A517Y631_9BACT|nr:hypothetical protein [Anatilimnocola aggregata]QDU25582.1 hypothetical protein ETAA8_06520 [Anatilimnocola aggregata]
MHNHPTSRRSFLAAAVAIALPIDDDRDEVEPNWDDEYVWEPATEDAETVEALAIFHGEKEISDIATTFAADQVDVDRCLSRRKVSRWKEEKSSPVSVRFSGSKRYVVAQCELWDRSFKFEPSTVLDIPQFDLGDNPLTDQYLDAGHTRQQAIELAAERNRPLLQGWDEDSQDWWVVLEIGECDLPRLVSYDLTGELGHMQIAGSTPIRLVRPTAAEIESIEREALLFDLAGEEGGVA